MSVLGDFADFEMGQAPPGTACNTEGVGTVFVKAGEFDALYPVQREWTTKPLKFGRSGDVFICVVGATAGKLNLGIDCAIGRSVAAIRPRSGLDTRFLYYQLQPWVLKLRAASTGSAQGVISKKQLAEIPIDVPVLDEQHRIVAEIEKQFSRLDEAVANLRRVKANLKRYRASVLNAAVAGWPMKRLEELLREPLKNGHSARASTDGKGLRAFTLSAVTYGDFSEKNTKRTVADSRKVADLWAQPGDIYIERSNTPELVGTARLYKGPTNFAFIPDLLIRVRVSEMALPEYLELALQSDQARKYFKANAQGISGTMPKIGQTVVRAFPVPLPPRIDQQKIVADVDRRLSIIREVEAEVDANLQRAQALRGAVLSRVFSGEMSSRVSSGRDGVDSRQLIVGHSSRLEPASVVMAARILSQLSGESTMGRVKLQKILYLTTYHGKVDAANATYVRMQAGPLDMPMLEGVIKRLNDLGWFREIARNGKSNQQRAYGYTPLTKSGEYRSHLGVLTTEQISVIDQMVRLMRTWTTEQCELLATVYGAWNDLIIWRRQPTVDAIVHEVLENWHETKRKFSRQQISQVIDQIKRWGIEPSGFGLPTSGLVPDEASKSLFED